MENWEVFFSRQLSPKTFADISVVMVLHQKQNSRKKLYFRNYIVFNFCWRVTEFNLLDKCIYFLLGPDLFKLYEIDLPFIY